MRQKIIRGSGFRGLLLYAANEGKERVEGKEAILIGGNMSGSSVDTLVAEFNSFRQLRPDIEKPVWHEALRTTAGENVTAERWNEIAADHIREIGLDPDKHPHTIWQHAGEDHIHIVACRIAIDGSLYLGKNEHLIASRDCQRLEEKYHLVRTSSAKYTVDKNGKHHIVMPEKTKPRSNELRMQERTGEVPPRQRLQEIITTAIKDRPSQEVYEQRLTQAGVTFKLSSNGYSYKYGGIPFKGSQLGNAYKWAQLQKSFTTREQAEQQAIYAMRNAAWEAEQKRRSKYRASRSFGYSICQLSYSILPHPMGQVVQIAAELLSVISKINDWREAHIYRNQVEKLTVRMNQIKADRLAAGKTRAVKPVVPATPAQSEALPPEKKTNPPFQQPTFEPVAPLDPSLTAAEIKLLGQANWEMLRYGENRRVRELQAITYPSIDVDVHRKPCPILVNGVPITEIENSIKPAPTQGITHTRSRK